MKQFSASKIRNIAIAGHASSGKTSLAEALLYRAQATDRLGKVLDGNSICDFDSEEIKRKVSVSSAVAPFVWKETKINLIDTPGLFDFAAGFYEGVRAAETVLVCISARSGVRVGEQKAFKLANSMGKSKIIFISKIDADRADFDKVVGQLQASLGAAVCPLVIPHMVDHKVQCYVNLLDNKAYKYDGKGNKTEVPMPDINIEERIATVSEAIAETDEELMEKFFAGEPFTHEEIIKGVKYGVRAGTLIPVLCGSAFTLDGIENLLDMIVKSCPGAHDYAGEKATNAKGETVSIECDETKPLAAYVFKTVADPFVGKLSYIKVVSGKLTSDQIPVNSRTGEPERLGKLITVFGKKQEDASAIPAGDIGAVTKLGATITGDTLCDPKNVVTIERMSFPDSSLSMAVQIKNKGDEGKVAQGMIRLMEEDPTITFEQNAETKQQVISGLGEQHLDVIVSKLKSKFGVDIGLKKPRVPYRETIRKTVKVQGKHKKQSGGHGQYGDVWIEFAPTESDSLVFEENVFGGSVPRNFFPAVEKGLQDCVKHGTLAGYPMVGLKATLLDGSYHPVDSSEMAFKMAASLAYKAGIPQASPALLEPIGSLKVYVPDANTGDMISDLNKRRGRVLGMNPDEDGMQLVEAEVPMSEMSDFSTALRQITQGTGYFTFKFERYELLPSMLEAAVIAEAKVMNEQE